MKGCLVLKRIVTNLKHFTNNLSRTGLETIKSIAFKISVFSFARMQVLPVGIKGPFTTNPG